MATDPRARDWSKWTPEIGKAFSAFLSEQSPVAFLVRQEMARGKRCSDAIDFICGEGSYAKFAAEIYHSIRARA